MRSPHSGAGVAPGAPLRVPDPGELEALAREVVRRARPAQRRVGKRLAAAVKEAGRQQRALFTATFRRAIAALVADAEVPTAELLGLARGVELWIRRARGEQALSLAAAMRQEQAAQAALDPAQWCRPEGLGTWTAGELAHLRALAFGQREATDALVLAIDAELAAAAAAPSLRIVRGALA